MTGILIRRTISAIAVLALFLSLSLNAAARTNFTKGTVRGHDRSAQNIETIVVKNPVDDGVCEKAPICKESSSEESAASGCPKGISLYICPAANRSCSNPVNGLVNGFFAFGCKVNYDIMNWVMSDKCEVGPTAPVYSQGETICEGH